MIVGVLICSDKFVVLMMLDYQAIVGIEGKEQGQEPEPVLAVGIGNVEVGAPVFLR